LVFLTPSAIGNLKGVSLKVLLRPVKIVAFRGHIREVKISISLGNLLVF